MDHHRLVAPGPGEGLLGVQEGVQEVPGGEDEPGVLPVPSPDGGHQVPLFGAGGHSRAGPAPLVEGHHQGRLNHPGEAQSLGHEAEAGAACGRGRLGPGEGGPHRHVHRGDLVLRLDHGHVRPGEVGVGLEEDALVRGGAYGVVGLEAEASGELAQSGGLGPGEVDPAGRGAQDLEAEGKPGRLLPVHGLGHLAVELQHLPPELEGEGLEEGF